MSRGQAYEREYRAKSKQKQISGKRDKNTEWSKSRSEASLSIMKPHVGLLLVGRLVCRLVYDKISKPCGHITVDISPSVVNILIHICSLYVHLNSGFPKRISRIFKKNIIKYSINFNIITE